MTPSERTAKWRRDNPDKSKAVRRNNYYANHDREKLSRRNSGFKRLYGITVADRDAMVTAQDGLCAACEGPFLSVPHIDHDHYTSTVRGILCSGCNQALGNIRDSVPRLQALIDYLERHHER